MPGILAGNDAQAWIEPDDDKESLLAIERHGKTSRSSTSSRSALKGTSTAFRLAHRAKLNVDGDEFVQSFRREKKSSALADFRLTRHGFSTIKVWLPQSSLV